MADAPYEPKLIKDKPSSSGGFDLKSATASISSLASSIGKIADTALEQRMLKKALEQRKYQLVHAARYNNAVMPLQRLVPGTQRGMDLVMSGLPAEPARRSR